MTATYRLQLHAGFTFADAESVTPYVADLGVTHLYLSPVLQAVPGSMHGYDVLDHTAISAELGGAEGFERLAHTAREHGLGLVVDVVPNHMAVVAPETSNAPLWDVLKHGRDAEHAPWFDIDWEALDGHLGMPVLWETLDAALAKGDLRLVEEDDERVLRYHDHVLPIAPNSWDGDPAARVSDVLARQHYRLGGWRERDSLLNYRRFFDVDSLIAVRVELPEVFDATHRLLIDLNQRGLVEGFRIDHPDGLTDPQGYLERLRSALLPGSAVWVEKILERHETLPAWSCAGTTGYDALRVVSGALADPATAPALTEAWAETGGVRSLADVVDHAKRQVVGEIMVPERRRLVRRACEALPDLDEARLDEAVGELLVACDVYRAYVRPGEPLDDTASARLDAALERALGARPDLRPELEDLIGLARSEKDAGEAGRDFAVRLQQTWGPVMAKSIEDTAYYRWHRLVALNEVGGDPDLLDDASPEEMHQWATAQQRSWPLGLTTLSTHDTKRSEDVRARLLALAGDAESWSRCSEEFADAARERDVDPPTAHLVWQTLAGVGTITEERLATYLSKAMRESKENTSWLDPDPDYEERVLGLATAANEHGRLRALIDTAVDHNRDPIRAVVLGQKLLQLTLPGVPDSYQGCEIVDLSLVDPDNRRPVDYDTRVERLAHLRGGGVTRDLDDEKLWVTTKALHLRKELPAAFGQDGDYEPVQGTSRHLVGFLRGREVAVLVSRATKRLEAAGGWADATVDLPEGLWRDELTETLYGGGPNDCAALFTTFPVALLRRVHMT